MYLESFTANFSEKTSAKSVYLLETLVRALSVFKLAILALFEGYTLLPEFILKIAMCITKVLYFRSRMVNANSFFSISLTYLMIRSTFSII